MQKFFKSTYIQNFKGFTGLTKVPKNNISFVNDTTGLNEEQTAIYDTALAFANENIAPYAAEWDREAHFPIEVFKKAAELGFAGAYCKEDYGGSGMSRLDSSLIFQALATGDVPTSAYISTHNMCGWLIDSFGSKELKEEYLPSIFAMEKICSYCLTEPGSGSDAAGMLTQAKEEGDYYVLNGSKIFISGGSISDVYIFMCKTGEKEVSALIVDKGTPGLSYGKKELKMGWRCLPTTMVMFEGCKVPKKNLIGEKGMGFKYSMMGLDGGRINMASCSLGGASFCIDAAMEYTQSRKQFGISLAQFQNVQFKLADMASDLVTSRIMVRNAAQMHHLRTMYAAMAKKVATDQCFDVRGIYQAYFDQSQELIICNYALQMHGGYGYLNEYPIERYVRDLRVHQILEGTNEIMRMIISRNILKD